MSKLRCCFCQQELNQDSQGWEYGCSNPDCGTAGTMCGTKELWQALIDSMKEHDLCHDALVKQTKELDRTRKALDVAKDIFNWIDETYRTGRTGLEMEAEIWVKVQLAAQKITALEQKEIKC